MRTFLGVFILLTGILSCSSPTTVTKSEDTSAGDLTINGKLYATVFQQQAAEYEALCFQAYNLARLSLDQALSQKSSKPLAIVTDVDETVLDNSPYAVHRGLQGKDYEATSWSERVAKAACDTLAGSLSFFTYAKSKGAEIFYITNRSENEREGTMKNLQRYGFPDADAAHLLLRQNTSSKEVRRQKVSETYEIVMLLGDNLADFSVVFDKKPTGERLQQVQQNASAFGTRFIVFPNTVYGDWEGALFNYNFKLTPAQKDSVLLKSLQGY